MVLNNTDARVYACGIANVVQMAQKCDADSPDSGTIKFDSTLIVDSRKKRGRKSIDARIAPKGFA